MPVYSVTYYVCSRCRHKEEAGEQKAGYGATTSCAPSGWTRAGFHPNANNDLCVKCSEELKKWLSPFEDRGL
jgi:hypothetical protein